MFSAGVTFEPQVAQVRQEIEELLNSGRADAESLQHIESRLADAIGREHFEIIEQLPHFIKQVVQSLTAAKVYQEFRLPGRDRIVRDLRDTPKGEAKTEPKAEKKTGAHAAELLALREGQLVRSKERSYENYFGDRSRTGSTLDQRAASDRFERLLSVFEKLILARFEGGVEMVRVSNDGRPRFLPKTEAEWREFFAGFFERTVGKRVLLSDIQDFLFRGVVQKGNKGIVISDLILHDGRVEKFVRFGVLAEALAKLKALIPGQTFGAAELGRLSSEDLVYLALAVSRGRGLMTSEAPSLGKFFGGAAEARAAAELGIQLESQLMAKTKLLRKRGGRHGLPSFAGHEGFVEDDAGAFVPWWSWGNLARPGRRRWTTIVFYFSLLAISLVGIGVMTMRLLR